MAGADYQRNQAVFDSLFEQFNDAIADTFYEAVRARGSRIQERLNELSDEFFKDVASHVPAEQLPWFLAGYVDGLSKWDDLSGDYIYQKRLTQGKGQRFYEFGGDYRYSMAALSARKIYGDPVVQIGRGDRISSSQAGGIKFDARIGQYRDRRGRFAGKLQEIYEARLLYNLFPKAGQGPGTADRFVNLIPGELRKLVAWGEYGVPKNKRPARPFVIPFAQFYYDSKAVQAVEGAIR
jgi:hypothetical protein